MGCHSKLHQRFRSRFTQISPGSILKEFTREFTSEIIPVAIVEVGVEVEVEVEVEVTAARKYG